MADYKSKAKKRIKRKVKNRIRKSSIIISITLILALIAVGLYFFGEEIGINPFGKQESTSPDTPTTPTVSTPKPDAEEIYFHFIDVGQGDAILVTSKAGNMIIDSGDLDPESQKALSDYLTEQGITSFKYAVFTHPDADHIGSADIIVSNYDVETVIMPYFPKTTQVYKRLISAIESREVELVLIGQNKELCEQEGYTFRLGSLVNTVMAPTETFKSANEMSVVVKSTYGSIDVLLTGDAEEQSEEAMLKKYLRGELDCEILKVGHHGSRSSTTEEFLDAVSPDVAIISCGEGNSYGHPHEETLDKLEEDGIPIYRTDLLGSVVIKINGKTFEIVDVAE